MRLQAVKAVHCRILRGQFKFATRFAAFFAVFEEKLAGTMKIQICGYSGSGKSTLARALGEKYNIPVLHMDNVNWYGDWQYRSDEEKTEIVNKFLSENESWVIDGNYTAVSPERFSECDVFILLLFNRFYCFKNCLSRYKRYKGRPRTFLAAKSSTLNLRGGFCMKAAYASVETSSKSLLQMQSLRLCSGRQKLLKNGSKMRA